MSECVDLVSHRVGCGAADLGFVETISGIKGVGERDARVNRVGARVEGGGCGALGERVARRVILVGVGLRAGDACEGVTFGSRRGR